VAWHILVRNQTVHCSYYVYIHSVHLSEKQKLYLIKAPPSHSTHKTQEESRAPLIRHSPTCSSSIGSEESEEEFCMSVRSVGIANLYLGRCALVPNVHAGLPRYLIITKISQKQVLKFKIFCMRPNYVPIKF
jgi:hypothetical protein